MTQETLGIEEVAALMKAEPDTVMQLARAGDLPGAKIGKAWVFMRDDVLSFLRTKIAAATAERRRRPSAMVLGLIVEKPRHGRSKPRPVLPDLPH